MSMFIALLLGTAFYSAYVWLSMPFHDALMGIAFAALLGVNAVFGEVEAIRKDIK